MFVVENNDEYSMRLVTGQLCAETGLAQSTSD